MGFVVDDDFAAGIGRVDAADGFNQCFLPAAVGSGQAVDFALV
jgi:hypothetical protein